ncbi:hypothetical protein AOXY_G4828 [Acipenser oxyrinchus oxyrinchus]|uniref:Zinc finger CW-type PWWP domain protein 2 n=1 Tax=Acipenser oxyrinchus oxyrinchus TaxID=40147 RepID=A0AAD8GDA3_ACIOX|nr:hypothetical protein AOXY_G4828 [Acipenser oxyrinchus oxyrinchus]
MDLNASESEASYLMAKIWIQCDSQDCLKWRLVPHNDTIDLDRKKPWYCHMNQDPFYSHCSVPEEKFPNEADLREHGLKFVYSKLPVGSLVMIKASKWPRWPAILCPDPCSGNYLHFGLDGHIEEYHAEFLGNPHSRFWASVKHIDHFHIPTVEPKNLKGLKKSYEAALEEAKDIQGLTCEERLQMCHFLVPEGKFLLSQAKALMTDLEEMIRQFTGKGNTDCQSAQNNSEIEEGQSNKIFKSQMVAEETLEEKGDLLIIDGITFKIGTCMEETTD